MTYFLLHSGRASAEVPTSDFEMELEKLECSCGNRLASEAPMDAFLSESLSGVPLNCIRGSTVGIIRDDLMQLLEIGQFHKTFAVGRVFVKGAIVTGFHTFIGRNPITIRGDATSLFRTCGFCQNPVYVALNNEYVLSFDVREGASTYSTGRSSIVVSEEIWTQILLSKIFKVQCKSIGIHDVPIDGLPADLRMAPRDLMLNISPQVFRKRRHAK